MITLVTDAEVNCVVPKLALLGGLLVRSTVRAPPDVIGLPEPVWRRTVIGPRLGVLDVAPDTAGELITSVSVSTVSVNFWVAFGLTPFAALTHGVGTNCPGALPDAVAWKEPALPTKNLVELALVIDGAGLVGPETTGAGLVGLETTGAGPVGSEMAEAWLVDPENSGSGALTQRVLTS
jgi:hypothetical protein